MKLAVLFLVVLLAVSTSADFEICNLYEGQCFPIYGDLYLGGRTIQAIKASSTKISLYFHPDCSTSTGYSVNHLQTKTYAGKYGVNSFTSVYYEYSGSSRATLTFIQP